MNFAEQTTTTSNLTTTTGLTTTSRFGSGTGGFGSGAGRFTTARRLTTTSYVAQQATKQTASIRGGGAPANHEGYQKRGKSKSSLHKEELLQNGNK